MLRIHSGVPGSGKTLTIVDTIEHSAEYRDRTVYAHAIDGWERAVKIRCNNDGCRSCRKLTVEEKEKMYSIEKWQEWCHVGSLLVVDEAHYAFPSRREVRVPQYIERLTEHRHDGIDIWLATPNVNFLDIAVRRLSEEHVHFVNGKISRHTFTHTEVMESDQDLRRGERRVFVLPKRSFKFYKSADAHVKMSRKLPVKVYLSVGLPIIAIIAVYVAWSWSGDMRRAIAPAPVPEVVQSGQQVELETLAGTGTPSLMADFRAGPRLNTVTAVPLPESDGLSCIASAVKCLCYGADNYRVNVSDRECRAVVRDSFSPSQVTVRGGRVARRASGRGGAVADASPAASAAVLSALYGGGD